MSSTPRSGTEPEACDAKGKPDIRRPAVMHVESHHVVDPNQPVLLGCLWFFNYPLCICSRHRTHQRGAQPHRVARPIDSLGGASLPRCRCFRGRRLEDNPWVSRAAGFVYTFVTHSPRSRSGRPRHSRRRHRCRGAQAVPGEYPLQRSPQQNGGESFGPQDSSRGHARPLSGQRRGRFRVGRPAHCRRTNGAAACRRRGGSSPSLDIRLGPAGTWLSGAVPPALLDALSKRAASIVAAGA